LIIRMENSEKLSLEQMRAFLAASQEVRFEAQSRAELYSWVEQTLRQQGYGRLKRKEGSGQALCGKNERIEPGAGDASDQSVSAG
jgi:hypothetical protein